ncbi:MAG: zinc ribbon domain-containing protein [Polyangiaceae bacterium]
MSLRALTCPSCGAPLPSNARRAVVICPFCKATVSDDGPVVFADAFRKALADLDANDGDPRPRVRVAGLPYRLIGRIAQGDSTDVFLAERARPLTERVVLKVLRNAADQDLLDREHRALTALHDKEDAGAIQFARRLPSPVARGRVEGTDRHALIHRAPSGFVHTFDDVLQAYPRGVDGVHAVWMWRRLLELLGWVHSVGFVHGAILPAHCLVHARDHGVMLVGWSCAGAAGERAPLPVFKEILRDVYPEEVLRGAPPSPATDLAMTARTIARVLGKASWGWSGSVPVAMSALVDACSETRTLPTKDAWELKRLVGEAAYQAYGPPRFHRFRMPDNE